MAKPHSYLYSSLVVVQEKFDHRILMCKCVSLLYVLSHEQYLLVSKDYNQATKLLGSFASHFQTWRGPKLQVEHLRIFYLTLQTWLGIASGQVCYCFWLRFACVRTQLNWKNLCCDEFSSAQNDETFSETTSTKYSGCDNAHTYRRLATYHICDYCICRLFCRFCLCTRKYATWANFAYVSWIFKS